MVDNRDKSNGYEQVAPIFIAGRGQNHQGIGAIAVAEWSQTLPAGASVLDLGCGTGVPISKTLIDRGFEVYGIDASPRMVATFQAHFPTRPIQCAAVEDSDFFNRTFDAILAWGLFFLLTPDTQQTLINKIGAHLLTHGRLLFTAPSQPCSWQDAMTFQTSTSLGLNEYRGALKRNNLSLIETHYDEGENHYYLAQKIPPRDK
jgi:2-polyprenyl-3-methyl-5-hydroxy-6-metoxy-1,4-benzoquinol methylase